MSLLSSFALALQFLTRIPVPLTLAYTPQRLGVSVLCYPWVGLLIGALLVLLSSLLPDSLAALNSALLLTLWVLLTGGLHLDGLADCSDAWVGGQGNAQRSLQIMKDPAAGPIAVLILCLVMLLKWSALISLSAQAQLPSALLIAPFGGRLSILILMLSTPYIRVNGLGSDLQQHLPKRSAWLLIASSSISGLWLLPLSITLSALAVIMVIRYLALQRLQGVTGDVYGASVEIVETSLLISMALHYGST